MTLAVVISTAAPVFAEKDIQAELEVNKQKYEALAKKSKEIKSEVSKLEGNLVFLSKNMRKTEEKIDTSSKKLKDLRKKSARYTEQLYKDRASLGGMIGAAQRFQRTDMPHLLLVSRPIDAARTSLIMKSVIPALNTQSGAMKSQVEEIEKIEEQITGQLKETAEEHKKISKQEKEMNALLEQRQDNYKKTESARKDQEAEVARLAKEAKNLDDLILKINKTSKSKGKSALPSGMILPVVGDVYTAFGETDDLGAISKGITFAVRNNARVTTPLSGKVRFAGPFQKYKQILIIEHSGGYHSLIAGLGRIDTVVGASLAAGAPVGKAAGDGDTPRIYYEFRQDGNPVNPQKILLAQQKQGKT